jgi:hypothetical protein
MLPGKRRALNGQAHCEEKFKLHLGWQERERGKPDSPPSV